MQTEFTWAGLGNKCFSLTRGHCPTSWLLFPTLQFSIFWTLQERKSTQLVLGLGHCWRSWRAWGLPDQRLLGPSEFSSSQLVAEFGFFRDQGTVVQDRMYKRAFVFSLRSVCVPGVLLATRLCRRKPWPRQVLSLIKGVMEVGAFHPFLGPHPVASEAAD